MRALISGTFALIVMVCVCCCPVRAQFQQYRNYSVREGLPSSEVYSMLQDQQGYLWFTTDMGVSRFDGYRFQNFNTNHGLADNTIFGVHQDQKSRIWFTSFSGKLTYYSDGRMNALPCNKKLAELLSGTFMTSIYVDEHDTIWAGTKRSFIVKIAPGWGDAQLVKIMMKNADGYLCHIGEDGFIYGGGEPAQASFHVYRGTTEELLSMQLFHEDSIPYAIRYSVSRISGRSFILTANKKIVCFNDQGIYASGSLNSTGICAIVEADGRLRVGGYMGLYEWSDTHFNHAQRSAFFDQKIITAVYRDKENGLWVCTEGNGAYCVAFTNFLYYTPADGLPQSKIACTAFNGAGLITGHLDGSLTFLDGTNVQRVVLDGRATTNPQPGRVVSVLRLGGDTIIATTGYAQYFVDQQALKATRRERPGARKLLLAADGDLWTLSYNRMIRSDVDGTRITKDIRFDYFADNFFEDRSGTLWICAINGLWSYDEVNGTVYHGATDSLLTSRIVDIRQSADGALWLASRGNGLIVITGDQTYHITEKNGLIGNMCRSVFVDSANVVWVGTNQGLSKVTYNTGDHGQFSFDVTSYTSRNGLLSNEVNEIFRHRDKLWTVHTTGISIFDPDELLSPYTAPPVYITGTSVNGSAIDTSEHRFSHDQNFITFNFIGLSYKDPGNLLYRYKMKGIDTAWVHTSYTSVNFQTLPPGEYQFLVEARNIDGNWSKSPATFSFVILPAWWQTWYFYLGVAVIAGALIALIFKNSINAARKKEERKAQLQNQIATYELNALRAQMNPHFIFNSINSVQYFITNNDPDSSQKYLSKFARLIRYVVDNSKLSSIALNKEIEALQLYLELEALRFTSRFEYHIHMAENVDAMYTQIPSMLIQPYVENAIWHGIMHKEGAGKIEITLAMKGDLLECVIEDNGVGRKKSQEYKRAKREAGYKSIGMTNTKERLDIINHVTGNTLTVEVDDLYNPDGTAAGTRVKLRIPVT